MNAAFRNLRRVSDGWLAETVTPSGLEICFDGTDDGPNPASLALAENVLRRADHFIESGLTYLRHFIVPAHFDCNGDWEAVGFEFGAKKLFANAAFALDFGMPDSDVYGLWIVAFRDYNDGQDAQPFAFARTQF